MTLSLFLLLCLKKQSENKDLTLKLLLLGGFLTDSDLFQLLPRGKPWMVSWLIHSPPRPTTG